MNTVSHQCNYIQNICEINRIIVNEMNFLFSTTIDYAY